MSLVIISPARNLDSWISALKKAAPAIEVYRHQQIADKGSVTFALAWAHPPGIFSQYPNLKCISSMGAGVDHLLSDPDIPENIHIVRILDPKLSQDMFEFSLAAIMNRLRSLTHYRINQTRGIWKKQQYRNMADVRIGIMGTGIIGNHTAIGLQQVGFRVHGWSRTPGGKTSYKKFTGMEGLPSFLQQTDILICLLPLTESTRGILNLENLRQLPRGAWLINLGRGAHLDEAALLELLDQGHLEGANLDVFPEEPLPVDHPFWAHPLIHVTPHVASLTTPDSVAPQIADNYFRSRDNKPLLNEVDRNRGY